MARAMNTIRTRGAAWAALGLVWLLSGCGDPQVKAIRALSDGGYDFEVSEYLRAAAEGKLDVVKMFHRAGMAVDSADHAGNTALLKAAEHGHGGLVHHLIEQGADAKRVGPSGESILMLAARGGDAESVRVLLGAGADPTRKSEDNWTAVTIAALEGHADVVAELAPRSGENVDKALHVASVTGNAEVVDVLLTHGASVFARSPQGRTALMYAAENGRLDIVQLLLRNGANRFALDAESRTAAELASAAGHAAVFDYLSQAEIPEESRLAMGENPADAFVWHGGGVAESGERTAGVESLPAVAAADAGEGRAGVADDAGGVTSADAAAPLPRLDGAVVATTVVEEPASPASRAAGFPVDGAAADSDVPAGRGETSAGAIADAGRGAPMPEAGVGAGAAPEDTRTPEEVAGFSYPAVARSGSGGGAASRPGSATSDSGDAGAAPAPAGRAPELREIVRMEQYGEKPLPVMLADVPEEEDAVAEVRVLSRGSREPVRVAAGETVPDTRLRVVSVERKFTYSKQGKGDLVNVSRMIVEDTETGKRHLVVKDIPAASSETAAIMRVGERERYEVQPDDQFRVAGDAAADYRVLEVRPTQIIIENTGTGDVITVERFRVTDGR